MLIRNAMEQTLQLKVSSMTVQKFTEKHNVTLKLQNVEKLKNFEQRLIEDEQFRTDFVSFSIPLISAVFICI